MVVHMVSMRSCGSRITLSCHAMRPFLRKHRSRWRRAHGSSVSNSISCALLFSASDLLNAKYSSCLCFSARVDDSTLFIWLSVFRSMLLASSPIACICVEQV